MTSTDSEKQHEADDTSEAKAEETVESVRAEAKELDEQKKLVDSLLDGVEERLGQGRSASGKRAITTNQIEALKGQQKASGGIAGAFKRLQSKKKP